MNSDVQAGADAFLDLMRSINRQADTDFEHHWDEAGDPRDYVKLTHLVATSIQMHVVNGSAMHRQGFLRALADLICINVEGACVSCDGSWDPLKSSVAAYAAPDMATAAIRQAAAHPRK